MIYGHFDSLLLKMAVSAVAAHAVMLMVFFAAVAGSVHSNVSLYLICHFLTHSLICQARLGSNQLFSILMSKKFKGLNHQTHRNLALTIKRIMCDQIPISIYCHELFAYTNYSFLSVSVLIILVIN